MEIITKDQSNAVNLVVVRWDDYYNSLKDFDSQNLQALKSNPASNIRANWFDSVGLVERDNLHTLKGYVCEVLDLKKLFLGRIKYGFEEVSYPLVFEQIPYCQSNGNNPLAKAQNAQH